MRAKERDDGRFFLSLSMRTALERDSLILHITLSFARTDRFQAGLCPLSVISLCNRLMARSSERIFEFWKQEKATGSQMWRIRWLSNDFCFVFSQKFSQHQAGM